jgi:hypothetical protein
MAQVLASEMLTGEEVVALREILSNTILMSALSKVFAYDAKVHAESAKNEAISNEPNVYRIVQFACRQRAAEEWGYTIRSRMKMLLEAKP